MAVDSPVDVAKSLQAETAPVKPGILAGLRSRLPSWLGGTTEAAETAEVGAAGGVTLGSVVAPVILGEAIASGLEMLHDSDSHGTTIDAYRKKLLEDVNQLNSGFWGSATISEKDIDQSVKKLMDAMDASGKYNVTDDTKAAREKLMKDLDTRHALLGAGSWVVLPSTIKNDVSWFLSAQDKALKPVQQTAAQPKELTPEEHAKYDPPWKAAKDFARLLGGQNGAKIFNGLSDDMKEKLGLDGMDGDTIRNLFAGKVPPDTSAKWAAIYAKKPLEDYAQMIKDMALKFQDNPDLIKELKAAAQKSSTLPMGPDGKPLPVGADGRPLPAADASPPAQFGPQMLDLSQKLTDMAGRAKLIALLGLDPAFGTIQKILSANPPAPAEVTMPAVLSEVKKLSQNQLNDLSTITNQQAQEKMQQAQNPQAQQAAHAPGAAPTPEQLKIQELEQQLAQLQRPQQPGQRPGQQAQSADRAAEDAEGTENFIRLNTGHGLVHTVESIFGLADHHKKEVLKEIEKLASSDPQGVKEFKKIVKEKDGAGLADMKQFLEDPKNSAFLDAIETVGKAQKFTPIYDGLDSARDMTARGAQGSATFSGPRNKNTVQSGLQLQKNGTYVDPSGNVYAPVAPASAASLTPQGPALPPQ